MGNAIANLAKGFAGSAASTIAALQAADAALTSSQSALSGSLSAHIGNTSNPHATTAAQVGAYTTSAVDALLLAKARLTGGNSWYGVQNFLDGSDFTRASIDPATGVISGVGSGLTGLNASSISSGTIANARTTAASGAGANTIVLRDASGNFTAGVITCSQTQLFNIATGNNDLTVNLQYRNFTGATAAVLACNGTWSNSNTIGTAFHLNPTDSTTGTGGLDFLKITRSGSGVGSGAKNAIRVVNSTDMHVLDMSGNATHAGTVAVGTYTVAALPAAGTARRLAYASNGRKNGEGAGSGTGVLVFDDGTAWRAVDTGATVAA